MNIYTNLISLLLVILFVSPSQIIGQETYKIGSTEYYYNKTYSTTGKPMVKRSAANKRKFLKSLGYTSTPYGYEIDHIVPLSEGGTDDPSNMQLLTVIEHNRKTAKERANNTSSTYNGFNSYYSTTSTSTDSYTYSNGKKIYTGKNGGKYYINSNGNKTYLKSTSKNKYYNTSSYNSTYTSTCGARNKSGGYCKRKVKGGGRCHSHK